MSRFEPFALPRWHESAAPREFVVSFGRLLPLHKPSPFGDKATIQKLMVHSGRLTRKITTLLVQAAELGIRRKTECINLDLLIGAAAAGVSSSRPSKRSMMPWPEAGQTKGW